MIHLMNLTLALTIPITLGALCGTISERGGIIMLGGIPNRIEAVQAQLENTKQQMEAAKQELAKPFAQEAELKTKSARLAELDAELNMEKGVQQDEKDRQEQPLKARLAASCPQPHRERICAGMER